jgi:hypothetical protein
MTLRRVVLSSDESSALADLVADAAAIPAAAFSVSKCAAKRVIDLTVPAQRAVLQVPAATISLLEAAEDHIQTLSR